MKSAHLLSLATAWLALPASAAEAYYKESPLFSTAPDPKQSVYALSGFGPIGMSLELHQPAFTLKVGSIEPGSPADAAGVFRKGQIIESINGETLKDIDPCIQLGDIITKAEASDGVLRFRIKDAPDTAAKEVVVNIPVLGSYAPTWPLACDKSDKIVRNFAEYL